MKAYNEIINKKDENFIFGSELNFNCNCVSGIDNVSEIPNTAMFCGYVLR